MNDPVGEFAATLAHKYCEQPRLIVDAGIDSRESNRWRAALRHAGVPVLELNNAPAPARDAWLEAATDLSREFLLPVIVFGATSLTAQCARLLLMDAAIAASRSVEDSDWCHSRQVALTRAIETSALNQEVRRNRERKGWIRIGWQPASTLAEGNGLLLAWSSPLPLRRIRDFAARCPELTLIAADAAAIAQEVGAQGISVAGWRFAVK